MRTLILLGMMTAGSALAQNYQITPMLNCVDVDTVANIVTAYWGYESLESDIVQLLVGSNNRFIPSPASQGQPILFFPGLHERAFRTTFAIDSVVQWSLLGVNVPVARSSKPCTAAVAYPSLPPATVGTFYSQTLVSAGAAAPVNWSSPGPMPPGLSLSTSGILSGTPLSAGAYVFTVNVTDGSATDGRTYQMKVNGGVAINDPVSLRAPGFTPVLRTVTNVTSAITATASCGVGEFVITGGGSCTVPNVNTVQGRIAVSAPSSNGWTVSCSGGTATAVAVCQSR